MSKTSLPLSVGDISQFARTLRTQLNQLESTPSHLEMLNLLCKSAGYGNFQHFRAHQEMPSTSALPEPTLPEDDIKRIKHLVRHFDSDGRLIRWPKKFTLRILSLWVMWSRIPARTTFSELDINTLLTSNHLFEDHALLRRELVDRGYLSRTADGRKYSRIERQPPIEVLEVFQRLRP